MIAEQATPDKIAALLKLAGDDADDILALLGLGADAARSAPELAPGAEEQVLEEILRLSSEEAAKARVAPAAPPVEAVPAPPVPAGAEAEPEDELGHVSPRRFAQFLAEEHPQTVALVLASIPPSRAGAILDELPAAMRSEAISRLARLDCVPAGPLGRAMDALRQKMSAMPVETVERSSGIRIAASLLKTLGRDKAQVVIGGMTDLDPELAREIEQSIYTFEDLAVITPGDARKLVPRLDRKTLAVALSAAPDNVKQLVMSALSSGMRASLTEEMEYAGSRSLAEIKQAQQEIVQVALQMDQDGEIRFLQEAAG